MLQHLLNSSSSSSTHHNSYSQTNNSSQRLPCNRTCSIRWRNRSTCSLPNLINLQIVRALPIYNNNRASWISIKWELSNRLHRHNKRTNNTISINNNNWPLASNMKQPCKVLRIMEIRVKLLLSNTSLNSRWVVVTRLLISWEVMQWPQQPRITILVVVLRGSRRLQRPNRSFSSTIRS